MLGTKIKYRNLKIWLIDQIKRKRWFTNFFITGKVKLLYYSTKEDVEKKTFSSLKKLLYEIKH